MVCVNKACPIKESIRKLWIKFLSVYFFAEIKVVGYNSFGNCAAYQLDDIFPIYGKAYSLS